MQQKILIQLFESLLNAAAQAPTDDIVNRDGISLMKQGFELIMQAHRDSGASGPTSPSCTEDCQLLADIEAQGMTSRQVVTLCGISHQLAAMAAQIEALPGIRAPAAHIHYVNATSIIDKNGEFARNEDIAMAVRDALCGHTKRNRHVIVLR